MSEPKMPEKRPLGYPEPFPWHCVVCARKEVFPRVIRHETDIRLDGIRFPFVVENLTIPICNACGEEQYTREVNEQIITRFREVARILSPEQIRRGIERLGTTALELSERLRIAERTLTRWADGLELQPLAMDSLLRLYFGLPEVRAVLRGKDQDPEFGVRVIDPSLRETSAV